MSRPTITEVKTTLAGIRKTFDCELLRYSDIEVIVMYRMPEDMQLEDLWLPRGTISLGYFFEDRPYNVYQWLDQDGQTLALYFNICDNTRISKHQVSWRDLTLDILLTPDLHCRVLDEHELPENLDPDLLAYINATRIQLCQEPAALLSEFTDRSRSLQAEL